jgi:hypothetical protein
MYLQDLLLDFCDKIQRLDVQFQLSQVNAKNLPGILEQYGMGNHYFDRIEVRLPIAIILDDVGALRQC